MPLFSHQPITADNSQLYKSNRISLNPISSNPISPNRIPSPNSPNPFLTYSSTDLTCKLMCHPLPYSFGFPYFRRLTIGQVSNSRWADIQDYSLDARGLPRCFVILCFSVAVFFRL